MNNNSTNEQRPNQEICRDLTWLRASSKLWRNNERLKLMETDARWEESHRIFTLSVRPWHVFAWRNSRDNEHFRAFKYYKFARDTRKIWFKTWEFYALKDTSRLLIIIKTKQQTISAIVTCNIAFRSLTDTWAMSWQADGSDFRTDICCTWQLQHGNIMTQVSHAELRMFDDAGYLIDLAVISPAVSTCEDNLKIMRGQEIFATAPY